MSTEKVTQNVKQLRIQLLTAQMSLLHLFSNFNAVCSFSGSSWSGRVVFLFLDGEVVDFRVDFVLDFHRQLLVATCLAH